MERRRRTDAQMRQSTAHYEPTMGSDYFLRQYNNENHRGHRPTRGPVSSAVKRLGTVVGIALFSSVGRTDGFRPFDPSAGSFFCVQKPLPPGSAPSPSSYRRWSLLLLLLLLILLLIKRLAAKLDFEKSPEPTTVPTVRPNRTKTVSGNRTYRKIYRSHRSHCSRTRTVRTGTVV
jgi:hypothetical protein